MVAKISSGSLLYSVLAYNQTKVDERMAMVIFTNRMIEPKTGEYDIAVCMRSFEPYLLANQRTEKPVLHISINPDPNDKLSEEQLSEIAQTYMDKMGYGDQPFIVYKHEDIDRHHIHIVSLRVDENGRKLDHNFEYKKSMNICRALELQYGLVPADQKQRQESTPLKAVDYEKGDVKRQVANVIRPVAQGYHFQSLKEYKALLSFYNVHVEEVRGEVKGKQYRGLVYSALNSTGEKVGNPFNASSFGKSVGIDALEKRIEKSVEIIRHRGLKDHSKKAIVSALKSCSNRSSFEKELAKKGITVLFRENEQGRIYGATFIDHDQKTVFNGSRLGKEFSANVFNDLFRVPLEKVEHTKQEAGKETFTSEGEQFEPSVRQPNDPESILGGLLSVFIPETGGYNGDNHPTIRKRKKRKRRFGRQM
jgi:hypothetical protein